MPAETGRIVYYEVFEADRFVVPGSNYHVRIAAPARLKGLFDAGEYETIALPDVPIDPLECRDERRYTTASRMPAARPASPTPCWSAQEVPGREDRRRRAGLRLHGRLARHRRR